MCSLCQKRPALSVGVFVGKINMGLACSIMFVSNAGIYWLGMKMNRDGINYDANHVDTHCPECDCPVWEEVRKNGHTWFVCTECGFIDESEYE